MTTVVIQQQDRFPTGSRGVGAEPVPDRFPTGSRRAYERFLAGSGLSSAYRLPPSPPIEGGEGTGARGPVCHRTNAAANRPSPDRSSRPARSPTGSPMPASSRMPAHTRTH